MREFRDQLWDLHHKKIWNLFSTKVTSHGWENEVSQGTRQPKLRGKSNLQRKLFLPIERTTLLEMGVQAADWTCIRKTVKMLMGIHLPNRMETYFRRQEEPNFKRAAWFCPTTPMIVTNPPIIFHLDYENRSWIKVLRQAKSLVYTYAHA